MSLFDHLLAAVNITGPILIILVAGITFKKIKLIDDHFVSVGNNLVFKVTLPCLLFLSVASGSPQESLNPTLVIFAVIATLIVVALLWLASPLFVEKPKRGVFVQCSFRGNIGILGLAMCVNAFGEGILPVAAVCMAVLTILYNVVSVILMSDSRGSIFKTLAKNPLIIAIISGFVWSLASLPVPRVMDTSLGYLARLTLPLALVCVGASLEWQSFKTNHRQSVMGTLMKLVVVPLVIISAAIAYGLKGEPLGILFLFVASPTAAAAYIMSRQMTNYSSLAAEIITLSTLLCPITVTLGLVVLGYYQLV